MVIAALILAACAAQEGEYAARVRPVITKYCLECHSTKVKKGELDLERFTAIEKVRRDPRPWTSVLEMLETGEMPPKKATPLPSEDRARLIAWVRTMLETEARAHAGDPGRVVVRRLSNAEYNNTIRDLTGVDLEPARDFPVDGAAGEGFTNTGDALVISPTLLNKYLNAAREVGTHLVLLPDDFRFSRASTRRDCTDEAVAELRAFYAAHAPKDGKLPLRPYLSATLHHREELAAGKLTIEALASKEKLAPKYLRALWEGLTAPEPSFPLNRIRSRWCQASPADIDSILAEVTAWQEQLWRLGKVGSYVKPSRQEAALPALVDLQKFKMPFKIVPGQDTIVLHLAALEIPTKGNGTPVTWRRPRFVSGKNEPLLLKDYARYGGRFEIDFKSAFGATARYLGAAAESAADRRIPVEELATRHGVHSPWLRRWIDILALESVIKARVETLQPDTMAPAIPLEMLETPIPATDKRPAIRGWRGRAGDLPSVLSNSSDQTERIPGRASPHKIVVHPLPDRFVAVVWQSPCDGLIRYEAKVSHAHPACGNGVAWWIEARRDDRSSILAAGAVDVAKEATIAPKEIRIRAGDSIALAIDARDGSHVCDLTEIDLTLTEVEGQGRAWNLSKDTADDIAAGNPHADRHGNRDVWRFVQGPSGKSSGGAASAFKFAPDSILGRWRAAAVDPKRITEAAELALKLQDLLSGDRPAGEKSPSRTLYDSMVSVESPLLRNLDLSSLGPPKAYGIDPARFGADGDLALPANQVVEVRLPAALLRDHEFLVEGAAGGDRVMQFQVLTAPPPPALILNSKLPCVADPAGEASKRFLRGLEEFRNCFPMFTCYPRVIPDDEVVCLKLFHREDEPLLRLFLDEGQTRRLDRLWEEHRFITRWPVTEHENLPLFIGFVTQDQTKEMLAFFEAKVGPFRDRATEFEKEVSQAAPIHLKKLLGFAARAWRRPLKEAEQTDLTRLYEGLKQKSMTHEEAFRSILSRILVSPSFLFRLEDSPPGPEAKPVSSFELATRLSYFLWSTTPDEELHRLAAAGRLQDTTLLSAQADRMLKDPRVRGLAVEFATQWLHVRDIRANREKNEKLFPSFDDGLREALFEETVLFFQHLFQEGRPMREILDADYTFLNEKLAKHYAIPGVTGPQWRRVEGVKQQGRGGVLGLASMLTKQSGASRTSPILRGNWLVETLLGEKLPRPPADVPRLPDEESATEGTVREMVTRHTRNPECAACHVRIDPFGFALEKYDPIGRLREKDLGGRPVDTTARLMDGSTFEGLDGLRDYLLKSREKDFQRTFLRKLLGFSLGRAVTLSDQPLLEDLAARGGRLSDIVTTIVLSKQFRYHRGLEATRDE